MTLPVSQNPLGHLGVLSTNPPNFLPISRPPLPTDINANRGDFWCDTSANPPNIYQLCSLALGVANWRPITQESIHAIGFLTADTGANPVIPSSTGFVSILGQSTPNTSGILVTAVTNGLQLSLFSPFVGDFSFISNTGGQSRKLTVSNTVDAASSSAQLIASVAGPSSGDPSLLWSTTATNWIAGIDNSDSDSWVLSLGNALGTTNKLKMTTSGILTIQEVLTWTGDITDWSSGINPSDSDSWNLSLGDVLGTTNKLKMTQGGALTINSAFTLPSTDGTTGQQLQTDGLGVVTWESSSGPAFIAVNIQQFTSSGTYTPTAGMAYCAIQCLAAGGAGGGSAVTSSIQYSCGGGGGSGEYAAGIFTASDIGASQVVTIGTGGTGVSAGSGNAGGNSSVGTLIVCHGGSGGLTTGVSTSNTSAAGGAGGTGGSGGTFRSNGQAGGLGVNFPITMQWGGYGAPSVYGGSGIWTQAATSAPAGTGYGGGGSGSVTGISGPADPGGAGANGIIIITEYIQSM